MRLPIWRKNKILVKNFINQENNKTEMALLSFDGKIRDKIVAGFNKNFLIKGEHIKNGGISDPKIMLSLLGGGSGALGLAGAASGKLFMATANPATLMSIGNGVGSAVMGPTGIVAHAPFLPVTGAIMPVVAPLIAFQALSTITIMKQFEVVNRRLDKIQDTLNTILQRGEATFIGEIISASNRITDIEEQFSVCNRFSDDMIIRLALLEDKINPIFERYNYLYKNQDISSKMTFVDLKLKQTDAFMAIVTSILDIRINLLKMKLNIQNNPGYIKKAANSFAEKIDFYHELWIEIRKNPDEIVGVVDEINNAVSGMNWWQKNMPSWVLGKRNERKELENKSNVFDKEALQHQIQFDNQIESAIELGSYIKKGICSDSNMSLIYWQDKVGEHCYYTDDLLINYSPKQ
ncbi:MAG: hypothetical protein ACOX6W_17340 [Lentisphaeria bacterium]|jgi:hypothetical protein